MLKCVSFFFEIPFSISVRLSFLIKKMGNNNIAHLIILK